MIGRKWLFLLIFCGCNQNPVEPVGPQTGSETHWLETCDTDAECGEDNACVCGVCTAPCTNAGECVAAGPQAICALAGAPEAVELCGALPAGAAGVCAQRCDGGCPDGQACGNTGICRPVLAEQPSPRLITQAVEPPAQHPVDFLFVVDNSGSMCQEQRALARAVEAVVPNLSRLDYRIAVTSADLVSEEARGRFLVRPSPPMPSLNCQDEAGEPLVPDTADCADFLDGRVMPEIIGAREIPDLTLLKGWFRCLVTLGTTGDGFEKGLSGTRLALGCDGPNADHFGSCCTESGYDPQACAASPPDFLRPEADLVVVYVTDEDDCSDRSSDPFLSELSICRAGPNTFEGDFEAECGDMDPSDCFRERCVISRDQNANCEWLPERLLSVTALRDQLLDLKGNPGNVAIWSFVGAQAFDDQGRVLRFTEGSPEPICNEQEPAFDPAAFPDQCCVEGLCPGPPQPSCDSALGSAYAGHRYIELAQSLPFGCAPGDPRIDCGICSGFDLQGPLATLPSLAYSACLEVRPACLVLEGVEFRSCTDEERADPANYTLRAEASCPDCIDPVAPHPLAPDTYALIETDRCPTGLMFAPKPDAVPELTQVRLLISR